MAVDIESHFAQCRELKNIFLTNQTKIHIKLDAVEKKIDKSALLQNCPYISTFLEHASLEEKCVLYQAYFIDIHSSLFPLSCFHDEKNLQYRYFSLFSDSSPLFTATSPMTRQFVECLATLLQVDQFYASLGGLIGYYVEVVVAIAKTHSSSIMSSFENSTYFPPCVSDVRHHSNTSIDATTQLWKYIHQGVMSLIHSAEFYVVGGAGDRLNLVDPATGEAKPAACLRIFKKTLLQWLFDDLDAREYWYYLVTEQQISVPVVMMTSLEKKNDLEVEKLCKKNAWFHKNPSSIFRIVQPFVPLIDEEGQLVALQPFQLALKPGGHGVIWKLAQECGVYTWLKEKGIKTTLIRQVNNPLSGMDVSLCALLGQGVKDKKSFGFACCPRKEGFHEGLIVVEKKKNKKDSSDITVHLSNIEYVAFDILKKSNPELFSGSFPANVNLLFADIQSLEQATQTHPFPGLIVNMKNDVEILQKDGSKRSRKAARLESTMQNISTQFFINMPASYACQKDEIAHIEQALPSFVQIHEREKILSAIKRSFDPHSVSQQLFWETPVSFLYNWIAATHLLLKNVCRGCTAPLPHTNIEEFLQYGPEYLFTFCPALGPFWEIIAQKIQKITIYRKAHLHIGLAEVYIDTLFVTGAFLLEGEYVTAVPKKKGTSDMNSSDPFYRTKRVCRAYIKNIVIHNTGIHKDAFSKNRLNQFVQGDITYQQACTIRLHGCSEIWMEDVTIIGSHTIEVIDGMKVTISQKKAYREEEQKELLYDWRPLHCELPSWKYNVSWQEGAVPQLQWSSAF